MNPAENTYVTRKSYQSIMLYVRLIQVKKLEEFDELLFVELLNDAAILLDNSKRALVL